MGGRCRRLLERVTDGEGDVGLGSKISNAVLVSDDELWLFAGVFPHWWAVWRLAELSP